MIRITVDTVKELDIVRRVLHTEACSHTTCINIGKRDLDLCAECVDNYCRDKVKLYKKETVEIPQKVVV